MDTPNTPPPSPELPVEDATARSVLLGTNRGMRFGRRGLRVLPSEPRCKLCAAPFRPPFSPLMRLVGKAPWPKNPKYCSTCFKNITDHRGGAEIEASYLFADVRGSTTLAESIRPLDFRARMDRFFEIAAHELVRYDAIVDKFVGDEVIGIFVPVLAGRDHAAKAIAAGRGLFRAMAAREPTLPIGAGVHTGVAYVGTVGEGTHVELTAMGDAVNVTARLASAALAGELLVTTAAAASAGLRTEGLERRQLELKGRSEPTDVYVLRSDGKT
jgi:adenylate cyclase